MDVREIRVLVPTERETEFYRWFADWRDGVLPAVLPAEPPAGSAASAQTDNEERFLAAVEWWRSLKRGERGIWGLWIDAAPDLLTADQIVTELGLNGPRDIPGSLSWSGRKGEKVGFPVHWTFEYDAVTGAPLYGLCAVDELNLTAVEYADLLRRARAEVDG